MNEPVYILWDRSYIWGLIAWRALTSMGVPHRLLKAASIAQEALSGKPPSVLLVPGGRADKGKSASQISPAGYR